MKPEDITTQFFTLGCRAGGDMWTDKDEKEYQVLKKQILEALKFYDLVKNGEICNIMKHRELEQQIKELKEEVKIIDWLKGNEGYQQMIKNKETLQKVREWYGINQIHIPIDEAVKMIKILKENKK